MDGAEGTTQMEKALLELRSLIMRGEFGPNERLPEVAIAERLGISRTPLRQAMDQLIAEGLLERIKNAGCRVVSFSQDDIHDAIELRGVVEGTCARMAAERGAPPELIAEGEAILDELDQALRGESEVDFDLYRVGNKAFHDLLARLPGSKVMQREAERIVTLPLASPSAFVHQHGLFPDFWDSLQRAQQQHRAILEAIQNREGTRAEYLSREHARLARRNLEHLTQTDRRLATNVPGFSLVQTK